MKNLPALLNSSVLKVLNILFMLLVFRFKLEGLCALFHKHIIFNYMETDLDKKIGGVLEEADRMFLATSVGGNSSGAAGVFSWDGDDLIFFTFNPTRKAEQIRINPRVHVVIWPKGQEGIKGLQIDGECYQIKDSQEICLLYTSDAADE